MDRNDLDNNDDLNYSICECCDQNVEFTDDDGLCSNCHNDKEVDRQESWNDLD